MTPHRILQHSISITCPGRIPSLPPVCLCVCFLRSGGFTWSSMIFSDFHNISKDIHNSCGSSRSYLGPPIWEIINTTNPLKQLWKRACHCAGTKQSPGGEQENCWRRGKGGGGGGWAGRGGGIYLSKRVHLLRLSLHKVLGHSSELVNT